MIFVPHEHFLQAHNEEDEEFSKSTLIYESIIFYRIRYSQSGPV